MSGAFRLADRGRIDRSRPIGFSFDGTPYQGYAGDTLASALLANGVHLMGRSFKYHRPRGVMAAGAEEPNALVTVTRGGGRHTPNLRATQVELYDGLVALSQNRWPSLRFDLGAAAGLVSPLIAAGFYYKTFIGPPGAWRRLYEPLIRRAAGLGRAAPAPDPDRYANRYAHCDLLVVGAGPAGLAAARAAARAGERVILCDEQAEPGGCLLAERTATLEGRPAAEWLAAVLAELAALETVTLLPRTQAFGYYAQGFLGLAERVTDHLATPDPDLPRERLWQVRAGRVVLATGAIERPLVFPGNDRPGVMLADAARSFLNRWGTRPGSRVVVATTDDSAYRAALDLAGAGIEVALIADLRATADGALPAAARAAGLRIATGAAIAGTRGRLRVSSVEVALADGRRETVACDLLLASGGWTPSVHLFSQSRGKLRFDPALQAYVPGTSAQAERSVGGCRGTYELDAAVAEGSGATTEPVATSAAPPEPMPGKFAFVDFQNDVTADDIGQAVREGFRSIEHVKRFTTTGMATDQGKTSNMNALATVARATGKAIPEIGLTTFRQPYTPVTFGTFAGMARGPLFDPVRCTPIHDWAVARGAVFEDVGLWKRARYFPQDGEDMHAAVARECRAVRSTAGIFDASTLGKIEVVGPDAAELLNRLYTNAWSKLAPGRCRYGLMLEEAGFVMDDGVVGRLAPDRFHVTTTTGGAARVLHHMEDYLQTEFPELQVWLTSVTEQWAVIAVQGPEARRILAPLVEGIDLDAAALPHMGLAEGRICGVPTRLFRVSFTGELGFEVNVPASHGREVWQAIWNRGARVGAVAYGTETMHVLRAEKGYVIVGQETDGTVTPDDLGLGWAIAKSKPDFVGKRGLARPDLAAAGRKQLVGLATADPRTVLDEGAQITAEPHPAKGTHALGHVTSAYWSETLQRSIALALVENGRARRGETLQVPMPEGPIAVTVTDPQFYDLEGKRLDG